MKAEHEIGARVRHATIVVERALRAAPARVFRAFSDPAERRAWDFPGDGWVIAEHEHDFRVDGRERQRFGPPDDPSYMSEGRFLNIAEGRRIISAGIMHDHGVPATATLCTIELAPEGEGTRVILTDQSAFFGVEEDDDRRQGWGEILHRLERYLADREAGR